VAAAVAERALVHGFALVPAPPVTSGAGLSSVDIDGAIVAEPDVDDAVGDPAPRTRPPLRHEGRQVSPQAPAPCVDLRGVPFRLPGGSPGADVFFVLSGYLITDLLCTERHRQHPEPLAVTQTCRIQILGST
jgi:hypothetical protein